MDVLTQIVESAKLLLTKPNNFFEKTKKEKGIKTAFKYFAALSLVGTILSAVSIFLFRPAGIDPNSLNPAIIGPSLVIGYLINLALSFPFAGLLHLWIRIWKGSEKFEKTYQIYVYTRTPKLILGWLPILSLVSWIYGIYLLGVGTQKIHKIGKRNVIIMYTIMTVAQIALSLVLSMVAANYLKLGTG